MITMKLRNIALITALTLGGCNQSVVQQEYLKDRKIEVKKRYVQGSEKPLYEGVRFKSQCWNISVDIYYDWGDKGKYEVTLRRPLISELDCKLGPAVTEVNQLVDLVERYRSPDPDCKIFDSEGKEYRIPRSGADLARKCYEQETLKKTQRCLAENAPKGSTVECR